MEFEVPTVFVQTMTQGTGSPSVDKPSSDLCPSRHTTQSLEGNTINNPDSLQRARAKTVAV